MPPYLFYYVYWNVSIFDLHLNEIVPNIPVLTISFRQ